MPDQDFIDELQRQLAELQRELDEAKRVVAALVIGAGGRVSISRRQRDDGYKSIGTLHDKVTGALVVVAE